MQEVHEGHSNVQGAAGLENHREKDDEPDFPEFIIDSMPIAVVALSSEYKITRFNISAQMITGYSESEAIGQRCEDILKSDLCGDTCPLKSVIEGGESTVQVETRVTNRQGEKVYVSMNVAALLDREEKLLGAVEAFQDISWLKDLERESSNLVSMLAHDMMSVLTGISGLALLILQSEDMPVEKRRNCLELIAAEARRLEALLADFIEYSRLRTGELNLDFFTTYVDKELIELCDTYRAKAMQHRIELKLRLTEPLPSIMADAGRLRRVFSNLLDNAIEYSREEGTVTITARQTECDVLVEIKDNGMGIAADDLPHVFDLFYRGRSSGARKGTGMGLAIAKAIVQGHAGTISATSQPTMGSTFQVGLPKRITTEEWN